MTMNLKLFCDRRIGVAVLLSLGAILAISPAGTIKPALTSPLEIADVIFQSNDQVSPEELAEWLIDKRADLMIVDLRTPEEYQNYHIESAINIPLTRLFTPEGLEEMNTDATIILYSNGESHAAQAWVLLKQLGIDAYMLNGGLNYWAEAIINPQPPGELVADSEILKYQFRKAASAYFSGATATKVRGKSVKPRKPAKKVTFKRKRNKVDEGC